MKLKKKLTYLGLAIITTSIVTTTVISLVNNQNETKTNNENKINNLASSVQPRASYKLRYCSPNSLKSMPSGYKQPIVWFNMSNLQNLQIVNKGSPIAPNKLTANLIADKIWQNRYSVLSHSGLNGAYGWININAIDLLTRNDIVVWNVQPNTTNQTVSFQCSLKRIPISWESPVNYINYVNDSDVWVLSGTSQRPVASVSVTSSGVDFIGDNPKYSTQISKKAQVNWTNTLAQSISEGFWVNDLKQELINSNAIANPTSKPKITVNDFDLVPFPKSKGWNCDNSRGEFYGDVVFKPGKYYKANVANTTTESFPITVSGFMTLNETTPINPLTITDNLHPNRFANSITINEVQDLVNNKGIKTFLNNPIILNQTQKNNNSWVKDTSIKVISLTPNNLNGYIDVTAEMSWYSNNHEIIKATPKQFNFKLDGYYNITNNPSAFTTSIPNSLTINANSILAQEYINNPSNYKNVESLIVNEIQAKITNPNPNPLKPLNQSIVIKNYRNFNNSNGSIVVDITLDNENYWDQGKAKSSYTFNNITINGFKSMLATFVEPTFNVNRPQMFSSDYKPADANSDLNKYKNQLIKNVPANATYSIQIVDNNTYIMSGKVLVKIGVTNYFDTDNNCTLQTGTKYFNCFFEGFKSSSNNPVEFTTIVQNAQLSGVSNIYARDVNKSNLQIVLDAISKSQAIKYATKNKPPITANDLDIDLTNNFSYNNLQGSITCLLTIKNGKAWIKGVPQINPPFVSKPVTFTGFKIQNPTKFNQNVINVGNYQTNGVYWKDMLPASITNQMIFDFINKNPYRDQIYLNLPTNANINIIGSLNFSLSSQGKIQLYVDVSSYYDNVNASLINSSMNKPELITIEGFKSGLGATTSLIGNINCNLKNYLYSDINNPNKLNQITSIIINELVANQNKYFSNLSPNEPPLTANDIVIEIDKTNIDNTTGFLKLSKLVINNQKAMSNGAKQASYLVSNNATVVGLSQQLPSAWKQTKQPVLNGADVYFVQDAMKNNNAILEQLINKNIDTLLDNPVPNKPIKVISIKSYDAINGTITATVSVEEYYDSKGILTNNQTFKQFQHEFIFNGFKKWKTSYNTSWKITSVSYKDALFKKLFGNDAKGFVCDWNNKALTNKFINHFTTYINGLSDTSSDKLALFDNPNNTKVANVSLSAIVNNQLTLSFTYSGIINGDLKSNINGSFIVSLRNDPADDGSNSNEQMWIDFKDALQTWINVHHQFPNNQQLTQIVLDFLNDPSARMNIPSSWLPNNGAGTFIDTDLLISNTPATIIDGFINNQASSANLLTNAISVIKPKKFIFPPINNLTIPTTYVTYPNVPSNILLNDSNFANLSSSEIVNNQTNYISLLTNTVINNFATIFTNSNPNMTISNLSANLINNNKNQICLTFTLIDAYGPTGLVTRNVDIICECANSVSLMDNTAWEKWVKYVVIGCSVSLFIALFICFICFIHKKNEQKTNFDI